MIPGVVVVVVVAMKLVVVLRASVLPATVVKVAGVVVIV
jgi:hypothetical protein